MINQDIQPLIANEEPIGKNTNAGSKRFKVALSFPGEHRVFVAQVAQHLTDKIGPNFVLYDKYYEAEFARPNLDIYLQTLYRDSSELIAVFLCADYEQKDWCGGLEWRVIRDIIKCREESTVMPLRFDNTKIPGLFSIDGYVWIDNRTPLEIAELIFQRYQLNTGQTYIQPEKPFAATNNIASLDVNKSVLALAQFIDRPQKAHHHIINHLKQDRIVKTCLCLFSSPDDKPIEFADSLGIRLGTGLYTTVLPDLLKNLDNFDRKILVPNPWDYDRKEDFISDCLTKIGENLGLKDHDTASEELLVEIFKVLNNAQKPKIMISDTSKKPVKTHWLIFSKRNLIHKINERFTWIKEVDAQLERTAAQRTLQQGFKPMVLLFCLQVQAPILDKAQSSCDFILTKITKSNFLDWRGSVVNLFDKSNIHDQLEPMEKRFVTDLTYLQFLKHLKSSLSPRKQP